MAGQVKLLWANLPENTLLCGEVRAYKSMLMSRHICLFHSNPLFHGSKTIRIQKYWEHTPAVFMEIWTVPLVKTLSLSFLFDSKHSVTFRWRNSSEKWKIWVQISGPAWYLEHSPVVSQMFSDCRGLFLKYNLPNRSSLSKEKLCVPDYWMRFVAANYWQRYFITFESPLYFLLHSFSLLASAHTIPLCLAGTAQAE